MFSPWKLVVLFALVVASNPSEIQASDPDRYDQDQTSLGLAPETLKDNSLSHSLYVDGDDASSPEMQGLYYEESMALAPEYQNPTPGEDEYLYADNPSAPPSPSPADRDLTPEIQDNVDEALYFPSEAPSPSPTGFDSGVYDYSMASQVAGADAPTHAYAPVFPFHYSAEDDAGEFSESYDEEEYPEDEKMNGSTIGLFVVGAVCVLGLGGLAYKKRRDEKRKQYEMYELARRGEF